MASVLYQEIKEVKCPGFSESISEGDVRWEKAVGDFVQEDEPLGEVETDKTGVPVLSPYTGVIVELLVEDGATVKAHQPLMKIDVSAKGDAPAKKAPASEKPPPAAEPPKEPAKPAEAPKAQSSSSGPIPTTPPLPRLYPRNPCPPILPPVLRSHPLKDPLVRVVHGQKPGQR